MATITNIWFFLNKRDKQVMNVGMVLKPFGEMNIEVPLQKDFHDCIVALAQKAADLHEEKMRSEILAGKSRVLDEREG